MLDRFDQMRRFWGKRSPFDAFIGACGWSYILLDILQGGATVLQRVLRAVNEAMRSKEKGLLTLPMQEFVRLSPVKDPFMDVNFLVYQVKYKTVVCQSLLHTMPTARPSSFSRSGDTPLDVDSENAIVVLTK